MSALAEQQRSKRQHFAAPGGSHDRLIRLLRVALPAIAGMLLAVLAFSPFSNSRELSFLLAKEGVDIASERMRLTQALYRGEDNQGRPFSIRAGSAVQKSSQDAEIKMTDLSASMFLDGGRASILAGQGAYNLDDEVIRAIGPLSFDSGKDFRANASDDARFDLNSRTMKVGGVFTYLSDKGFNMTTSNVRFDVDARRVESFAPVRGNTKVGNFSANKLRADLNARTVTLIGNAQLRIRQGAIR